MMGHVFISYMREDEALVEIVVETLERAGIKVWFDRGKLRAGTSWEEAIDQAVEDGGYFVACFSNKFDSRLESGMRNEIRRAIGVRVGMSRAKPWFIPVLFDPCRLPDWELPGGVRLGQVHAILLSGRWHVALRELTDILIADETVTGGPVEAHFDTPSRLLHEAFPYYPVQERWRALFVIYMQLQHGNGIAQIAHFREFIRRGMTKIAFAQLIRLSLDTFFPDRHDDVAKSALTIQALNRWDDACKEEGRASQT